MGGSDRIEIGGVARAHGIRGEIVIVTHDPDSDVLGGLETVWIGGVLRTIAGARSTPQRGWLVQIAGVATRNDAELLRGQVVEIERDDLELDDDDILLGDLIGCAVVLRDGTAWGEIAAIETGLQDRLVIHDRVDGADIERELPLVDQFVLDIDLDARKVTVDPPPGLPENAR